jgi:hypothetical protein
MDRDFDDWADADQMMSIPLIEEGWRFWFVHTRTLPTFPLAAPFWHHCSRFPRPPAMWSLNLMERSW